MVILQSHCTDRPIGNGQLSRDRGELVSLRNSVKESRAESDFDYLRMRALKELSAAASGRDIRVRRVHLEMAKRYQALLRRAEAQWLPRLRFAGEE